MHVSVVGSWVAALSVGVPQCVCPFTTEDIGVGVIVNKAARSVCVQVVVWTYVFISLEPLLF